jgi:hypothetical protein
MGDFRAICDGARESRVGRKSAKNSVNSREFRLSDAWHSNRTFRKSGVRLAVAAGA